MSLGLQRGPLRPISNQHKDRFGELADGLEQKLVPFLIVKTSYSKDDWPQFSLIECCLELRIDRSVIFPRRDAVMNDSNFLGWDSKVQGELPGYRVRYGNVLVYEGTCETLLQKDTSSPGRQQILLQRGDDQGYASQGCCSQPILAGQKPIEMSVKNGRVFSPEIFDE